MQPFEILTLVTLTLTFTALLLPRARRSRAMISLSILAMLLILCHLIVEGYRWQMIPAYALTALALLVTVRALRSGLRARDQMSPRRQKAWTIFGVITGLIVLTIATALPAAFPVFQLPVPTGPHAVGTRYFYWIDTDRSDTYSPAPDDYREVSVQIWYPAEVQGEAEPVSYMRQEAGQALAAFLDQPAQLIDHFALVRTHSFLNAGVVRTEVPFPVITFSPSGLMSSHMVLFEELASHGYVVLCIGHPYWNAFVYGANGEVRPFDNQNEFYRSWWEEETAEVVEAKRQITVATTIEEQERAQERHNDLKPVAIGDIRNWSQDIGFVLDQVAKLNVESGFLNGTLDLTRVGTMGFSKGGAATGQFCVSDLRCKAGINLTGFMYGDIVDKALTQPFLFMSQEETWCPDCYVNNLFHERAESSSYLMKVRGSTHSSFGGDSLFWGGVFEQVSGGAAVEGVRMTEIVNAYILAFFDKHLKGREVPLLDGVSTVYPEVVLTSRHPESAGPTQ